MIGRDLLVVACAVAAGCKSGKKAGDPGRPPVAGDATVAAGPPATDAAPPCVEIQPWGADAERAGIREVVHHPFHVDATVPATKDITVVPIAVPTVVKGWAASYDGTPPELALMIDDDVKAWIAYERRKVRVTAPPALEGAVWSATTMESETWGDSKLLAFDQAGAASFRRFHALFELPREREPFEPGGENKAWVSLELLLAADIDGDGADELVGYANVGEDKDQTNAGGLMMMRAPDVVLVVIWADDHVASLRIANLFGPLRLYTVPAALSGGAPMLFAYDGTRIRVVDRALVELPDDTPSDRRRPGADLGAQLDLATGRDAAPAVDAAPAPLSLARANHICLLTSATEPARLVPVD